MKLPSARSSRRCRRHSSSSKIGAVTMCQQEVIGADANMVQNSRRSESMLLRLMSRLSRLSRWLNDVTAVRLQCATPGRGQPLWWFADNAGRAHQFAAIDSVLTVPGMPLSHAIWL